MKILFFAKAKVLPIMLPVNVRTITLKSVNVPVTTIILNVTLKPGVKITDTIRHLVLFLNMLTLPVQVTGLCTNNAKLTMPVLVRTPDIPTHVPPGRSLKRPPAAVLMIHLTEPAALHPAVRHILP